MVTQDAGTLGIAAYRVLFEHSTDGVLFSSPDGRVTAANPAACAPARPVGRRALRARS